MSSNTHIATVDELDAAAVGTVIALGAEAETVNVALKTHADKWALAGQSSPMATAALFRAAIERDGYMLTILDTPEES